MPNVGDIFSSLLVGSRRNKKVCIDQALTSLKSVSTRKYLDKNSSNKWLDRDTNVFTWKSICEIIQHLLQDELRVLTSRRTNTDMVSSEFADTFRLLNVFLSCGLKTDLKLPLNEILTVLCGILTDSKLSHLQPLVIDTISALLWYLPVETQTLEAATLCRLQNWCFDQMKTTPSDTISLLLCQTVEASFYSRKILQCGFADLLESVLTCFEQGWKDRYGLGWFLRLFRWTVAEVCITPEIHCSLIRCFLQRTSIIFKMWNDFRDAGYQTVVSYHETLSILDVEDESSPTLAQAVGKCLSDPYSLDEYYIRVEVLKNLFSISDDSSLEPCLLVDVCFLADKKPSLFHNKNGRRPQPNSIDTGRELLILSRWILNTCLALKSVDFAKELEPFCRLLASFFTSEWNRCCNRMLFQAEDSLSCQLVGMEDTFSTFGALLVVIEMFKMNDVKDYLCSKLSIIKSTEICGFFHQLLNANELIGWLWWPVFDWMLRFQWQRAVAAQSLQEFNFFEALDAISNMLDSTKRLLGIRCAISTIITALRAATYCLKKDPVKLVDKVPSLEKIWNQGVKWFERLLVTKDPEQRHKNEKQIALMQDRPICLLFEELLKLDSAACGSTPPRFRDLSRLWEILLSTPNFGNPLMPWRYRLAVSIYLVYPKISMEILCSSNQYYLPSPIEFLFKTSDNFGIHRCYYLHWSLSLLLQEGELPHGLPSGDIVPDFGEKDQEMVIHFVQSHFSEPKDRWTRLFYHLVTGKQIETHYLQEAIDHVLSDFERQKGLSSVLFELLKAIPRQKWPSKVDLLIQNLLILKETKENNESILDVDLGVTNDIPIDIALGSTEDESMADFKSNFYEVSISIPLAAFSYDDLLTEIAACLQSILPTLSWKCAKDTKWLVTFLRHLTKARLSATAGETAVEIFCCLIDAIKDALKTQLVLKRHSLFLDVISGLNNFGLILCNYTARVSEEVLANEIWEQIAGQVVKLAETAWIAGGSRWPKIEEQFLPPYVSSVFCDAVSVNVKLHSVGLVSEAISITPLDIFLSQKDISTNFQTFTLLHRLSSEPKESLIPLLSKLIGFIAKVSGLKSPPFSCILDIILFHLISKLNQEGPNLYGGTSKNESARYPSFSQLSKQGSNSQSPLSLVISVCCCLIRNSDSPKLINQIILKRLANNNETYFKNKLRLHLLSLCLWEISNGQFDQSGHRKEFDTAAKVFGFVSFDEFLESSSHEYGAFLRLAGVEMIGEGPMNAEPIEIAAYLFGKELFIDYIQRLKLTDTVYFKSLSSIENLVEISNHLIQFVLLFANDSTNGLENNASLLGHYLISRFVILLVQLFPTHRADSTEVTEELLSNLTLEETVKKASHVLSKSVSLSPDFVLKLSESLLEAACCLLEDSSQSSEGSFFDPLGGYYSRVCVWLGIARFLILLSLTSSVTEIARNYLNWRIIGGIIDLLDSEYQRHRLANIGFLLSSLSSILDEILSHDNATPSDQLETAWHNSIVYLLVEISLKLPSLPDCVHLELSDKIDHILAALFHGHGGTRFSKAICQLDYVVTNGSILSSYEQHLLSNCTCNRSEPNQEVARLLKTLNSMRYPNLLKYRATGFRHLISLLQPKCETEALKLHERLVVSLHELEESKASLAAASTIQNWVPPAKTIDNTVLANKNRQKLRKLLVGLLKANDTVIIDSATRSAIAECIACLRSDFDEKDNFFESCDEIKKICFDKSPNPLAVEQIRTMATIVNRITSPNSKFSKLGPHCLRTVLSDPQLRSNLFENINIYEAQQEMSLMVKFAPFVSTDELDVIRASRTPDCLKFSIRNISELALGELCSNNLPNLMKTCDSQTKPVILTIAEWLFTNKLVLDDLFQACGPLILVEVSIANRLVPWIFALLLVNLKMTTNPKAGKLAEKALRNLIASFNSLIKKSEMEGFIHSVVMTLHSFSQWLIRTRATSNMELSFDWLAFSRSALRSRSVESAWLFYEFEWLRRPYEMLSNVTAQNLWIDLCKAQGDLDGLKAAQIAMAPFFDQSIDLENRFRCAISEFNCQWSSSLSSDDIGVTQIALHLHRIGADKAFTQLLSTPSMMETEHMASLIEAKYRVAWRSSPWKLGKLTQFQLTKDPMLLGVDFKTRSRDLFVQLPTASNFSLQRAIVSDLFVSETLKDVRQKSLTILSDWNASTYKIKFQLDDERLIYLLQKSICCEDWKHVEKLINKRRDALLDIITFNKVDLQEFSTDLNLLKAWSQVCNLEDKKSDSGRITPLILLQTSIEQGIRRKNLKPSSLMEATIRFAQALSDSEDQVSSLNIHAQLQLADLYINHGNTLHAEQLFKTIPSFNFSSQLLNMKRDLSVALTRSRLQWFCGETSLSCARQNAVLHEASRRLSNLKVSHDVPTWLLLESFLSSAVVLCKWFAESGSMSSADLISQNLKPAIELIERCWPPEVEPPLPSSADASALLAEFADAQFQAFDAYLKSPEFAARRRLLADADADAACLTEVDKKCRFLRLLQRQSTIESVELSNLFSSLQTFFSTAILSYCQCLAHSDKFNLKVYRLVSLWLNAASQMATTRVLVGYDVDGTATSETLFTPAWFNLLSSHLARIREDKFLPLFPQLLVRLTTTSSNHGSENKAQVAFKGMLERLIKTLLSKHPYHTGFPLLSLVNADLDDTINVPLASHAKRPRTELPADRNATRITVARRLFKDVCSLNAGSRAGHFGQMQNLARAYIEWANVDVEDKRNANGDIPLPSNTSLYRLSRDADRCLNLIPVVTCPPHVDPSGKYHNLVRVIGFANAYRLAGGLNLPKILTALCSDGRRRRQLVKGSDDPRQDAIMQQVFSAANHLLASFAASDQSRHSKASSTHSLATPISVKTYIVVPLARRSGLIEWCEGTIPLGDWLAKEGTGAHQRYHPTDLSPNQARLKLAGARDKPPERRMAIFSEICSKIQPVLGYFFVENFPEPSGWYAARRRYTLSLAASSILGYLVGLGDRHPQNLLLQPSTGEIVHIDLGIAFDQGRLLPTPEMVPFRLTRDITHALGPLGVETGFVGAAEYALRAFSSGSEIILTLLEVLLHDPLYSWSLSPAQLCALEARRAEVTGASVFQSGESSIVAAATNATAIPTMTGRPRDSVNQLAERVLLTVRDKLAGRVGGIGSGGLASSAAHGTSLDTLEPAAHAALLIRAATDPNNLGRMYFGWQAYL
nr:serine protein kinase ATM [Hymenolepis microstoma]